MTAMIEIDPAIQIRVLRMQVQRAEANANRALELNAVLIEERERLIAERDAVVERNLALQAMNDALVGYPTRLLLAE